MARTPLPESFTTAQISSSADAELPYATIKYAANNSLLNPIDAKDGTIAIIEVANMQAAPVTLYWAIKDQQLPAFEPIEVAGNTRGAVEVPIPWQHVSTCIGHTVLIYYTATVSGQLQKSLVLELEIQDVREADFRESLPVFLHSKLEGSWYLNMKQFEGDETIQIKAWPMIQAGQRLFVVIAGDQDKPPYQFYWAAFDHVVTEAEADADHEFELRLARGWMARRASYSALTAHMGVIWDGVEPMLPVPDDPVHENPLPLNAQDFHLRPTTLLIVDPTMYLPPPHLKESVGCAGDGWVVNPIDTLNGAHVIIAYDGMQAGDRVCPLFAGTPGPGSPALESHTVVRGESYLTFAVPSSAISANFASPITLSYTVHHNDLVPWKSPLCDVSILDISGLPTPVIEQATGTVLDLDTFSGDADATVIPWFYIEPHQPCWLWGTGKLADGSVYSFSLLEGEPVTEQWLASGVNTPLPRRELQKLANGSSFELYFAVNFNGRKDKASAKVFPLLELTISKPLIEIRELFEEQTLRTFSAGGVVETPTMKITFESGAGVAGIVRYGNTDFYSGKHFVMCENNGNAVPPQAHRFAFKYPIEYLKFGWAWKQEHAVVTFYDQFSKVIEERDFPHDGRAGFWVECSAPGGTIISSMKIVVRDYSFLDNFTMRYQS